MTCCPRYYQCRRRIPLGKLFPSVKCRQPWRLKWMIQKHTHIRLGSIPIPLCRSQVKLATVKPERGSPDSSRRLNRSHAQLAGPRQAMADQAPVEQVFAMVNWQARKILEAGGDQKVVILNSDDRGVGVEATYDRISESG